MSSRPTPRIPDLRRHVPPGIQPLSLVTLLLLLLPAALIMGWMIFSLAFSNRLRELCDPFSLYGSYGAILMSLPNLSLPADAVLREGAVMVPFSQVVSPALIPFWCTAAVLLGVVRYHYTYFTQDSKSIYLMARLPSRWERHRRAWALPLCGLLICLLTALLFTGICYTFYLGHTPPPCLPTMG